MPSNYKTKTAKTVDIQMGNRQGMALKILSVVLEISYSILSWRFYSFQK